MSLVKDYMRKEVSTIGIDSSAFDASKAMERDKVNYQVVLQRGHPVGIVTEDDLVLRVMAKGADPRDVEVSEFMSTPLVTIDPDASVEEAVELMADKRLRKLPVVKENLLYGIFTARDLIQHYDELEKQIVKDIIRLNLY